MKISINQELPNATFYQMIGEEIKAVNLFELTKKRNVVLVGMPGAFTNTCSSIHLPGLIENSKKFFETGIDEILCVVVNDVHVAKVWSEMSGAAQAGIKILADVDSNFTKSIGLEFSAPKVGFHNRLQRVAIIAKDNVVIHLQTEPERGTCNRTSGTVLLKSVTDLLKS